MDHRFKKAFTEVLRWSVPVDDKLGFLADETGAEDKSLRCAVYDRERNPIEPIMGSAFGEKGFAPIRTYLLVTWEASLQGLRTEQECELTKYGKVRVVNFLKSGDYARLAEIVVEQIYDR